MLPRLSLEILEKVDTDLAGWEDERAREVRREPALKNAGLYIFSLWWLGTQGSLSWP